MGPVGGLHEGIGVLPVPESLGGLIEEIRYRIICTFIIISTNE